MNKVGKISGIGIDLGFKNFIVTSTGRSYKGISSNTNLIKAYERVNKLTKDLKRKLEKNFIINKEGCEESDYFIESNNVSKLKDKLIKKQQKIRNIRKNYLYKIFSEILDDTKPEYITIEDIDIEKLTENQKIPQHILIEDFKVFYAILKDKCNKRNIELRMVSKEFPSTKMCCKCGKIKGYMSLKERKYICSCGNDIDRDLNAAINLANATEYRIIK